LRDDYAEFTRRGAEVVCVAPHNAADARRLAESMRLPFPVLADEDRAVFRRYDVQSRLWSLGQRPAVYIVDRDSILRWVHLGRQQWEIPGTAEVLEQLDRLHPNLSGQAEEKMT
jgi:peroxiredoxin